MSLLFALLIVAGSFLIPRDEKGHGTYSVLPRGVLGMPSKAATEARPVNKQHEGKATRSHVIQRSLQSQGIRSDELPVRPL